VLVFGSCITNVHTRIELCPHTNRKLKIFYFDVPLGSERTLIERYLGFAANDATDGIDSIQEEHHEK
jgi:hypothetical protein